MSQKSSSDLAMREYLTALLEEEQPNSLDALTRAPVEQLLEKGPAQESQETEQEEQELTSEKALAEDALKPEPEVAPEPLPEPEPEVEEQVDPQEEIEHQVETYLETREEIPPPPPSSTDNMAEFKEEPFQALFFNVAGLNLAVPLKSLGGIHRWQEPKPLFGKPKWYLGMMALREEQLNVVDSAQWVMPEKYTEELAKSLNYQYLVMLGESDWGLACETLVTTDKLEPEEVQWRTGEGKRPWLAGIVKEKMCALVDTEALVQLLEQGLDNSEKHHSGDPVS
ncbi:MULTISPECIES: chemotaxis protein CheW [Gammaproteobacteria]|uniref:chemotaxis protein CheW n=1 Tax=Gammaproteobacteria TaxID=1236 RepID=UPI000DD06228|nr:MULTISPECIES: chemotaxis protein CheW [Gammaproteobacteria]RTE86122.1 chemotaxis protein CheW [Aliidiomarina sp. B3213]TCZ91475.1 chemotaxis protein CheW [Lysobacter sp. N42]